MRRFFDTYIYFLKNKYKEITKKYNISMQKCVNLINIIKTLDPKPGRVCSDEKSVYIQPDVVVEKIEDEFIELTKSRQIKGVNILGGEPMQQIMDDSLLNLLTQQLKQQPH